MGTSTKSVKQGFAADVKELLENGRFAFFIFVVLSIGFGRSMMALFLLQVLEEHLGMDTLQVSIASASGILLESLVFLLGPNILKLLGVYWMLLLRSWPCVVRLWLYSLVLCPDKVTSPLAVRRRTAQGLAFD